MKNLRLITVITAIAAVFLISGLMLDQVQASVPNNSVTSIKVVDESLTGADIQNGSLTGADIQDGSLTGTDIQDGSITRTDIQPTAHQVVVATSGGDYTSISAALAAINPTATDPYVIDVMPGTYTENVTMKSYVHLRGAGREVTTIQSPSTSSDVIDLSNTQNVAVSGFTIKGGNNGIKNVSTSSVTISGNMVTGNSNYGIHNLSTSSPQTITENIISQNSSWGIFNSFSSPKISGNTITGNGNGIDNEGNSTSLIIGNTIDGNGVGILSGGTSSPMISGNSIRGNTGRGVWNTSSSTGTITGNTMTGNSSYGFDSQDSASPKFIHNRVTDNGGSSLTDINVVSTSIPNISFNIYDDITGTSGVGQYNVNSNGDPAPAP